MSILSQKHGKGQSYFVSFVIGMCGEIPAEIKSVAKQNKHSY